MPNLYGYIPIVFYFPLSVVLSNSVLLILLPEIIYYIFMKHRHRHKHRHEHQTRHKHRRANTNFNLKILVIEMSASVLMSDTGRVRQ